MRRTLSVLFLLAPLAAQAQPAELADWMQPAAKKPAAARKTDTVAVAPASAEPAPTGIRHVGTARDTVPQITTKLRFTTMIQFPEEEKVMRVHCGDCPTFWQVSHEGSIVHVKPSEAGTATNLNVVTTSGTVYSFLVREGRADGKPLVMPDLKVYVDPDPETPTVAKWIPVERFDAVQAELIEVKAQLEAARSRQTEQAAEVKRVPGPLQCDYGPVKNEKPFHLESICHDDDFTYIRTTAKEAFTIYELKDDESHVLNIHAEDGLYTIPKVLERAVLTLGDKRFHITQRTGH